MNLRVLTDTAELDNLSGAWDGLVERSAFPHVFALSGFARAWWRGFGGGRRLRLTVLEKDGVTRLVAPFYADATAPSLWKLIGEERADYGNLVVAAGDDAPMPALLEGLAGRDDWELLRWKNLPPEAAELRLLPNARDRVPSKLTRLAWLAAGPYPAVYRRWQEDHPFVRHDKVAELGGLLDRPKYRKLCRWYERRGELSYECATEAARIRELLPKFLHLQDARWKTGPRPDDQRFLEALVETMTPYRALRLDALWSAGRLVAAHLGFYWRARLYWYLPCYDPELAAHSPGRLLLAHVLQAVQAMGAPEVDFLRGRETYKDRYASDVRRTASALYLRNRRAVAHALLAGWHQ